MLEVVARDIAGYAVANAVLDHYRLQPKPATRDSARAKLAARVSEIDKQSARLTGLLGETTAPQASLRTLE